MKKYLAFPVFLFLIIISSYSRSQNVSKTDSLIKVLDTQKNDSAKLKTLYWLSSNFLLNEPDKSLDYSKQMLSLAQQLNAKEYIIYSYENIGGYYYYRNNNKLADEYSQKELEVVKQTNNKKALYGTYAHLSLLAGGRYDYPMAFDYSDKALQIVEELKDSAGIAVVLSNRAIIYTDMSDFPGALNYLLKALSINEKIKNKSNTANNYYNIGSTYLAKEDNKKALDYFLLSITKAQEANNRFQIAQTLVKIGQIYQNEKDLNKALDYYNQAITIGKEIGSYEDIISGMQGIAMVLCEQGKYNDAIHSIQEAIKLSDNDADKLLTGNSFGYLGEIYLKEKNYRNAIIYLKKSISIYIEVKAKNDEAEALNNLAACYKAINNFKQEADCLEQYQLVENSIINEETIKKTAEIEAKYQLEKKESEIAILTKDKELLTTGKRLQQLEINKQTFLRNSFLVGVVILLVLSFFIYRNYRTRQLLKLQHLRTKIASDLHDDIGSTLSSISVFSLMASQQSKEVIPLLDQIGEYSRKMLDSMADIVWTINPENDNFEKIILRMRSFAFEMMRAKNITYKFSVDESVNNLRLSMEERKNLYLIFKEATNNIIKYAETDSALFSISHSKNSLTMLIRDKGKGFDIHNQSEGNGLKNMRMRASAIGAKFLIESEPGKGTTIQLLIKAA